MSTSAAYQALENVLMGPQGAVVLRALAQLGLGKPLLAEEHEAQQLLTELGLGRSSAGGFRLESWGTKCADAAREYTLWTGRGRSLHFEGVLPAFDLRNFEGKRVLEIGPGWGCNLFRLQGVTAEARGCEIEAAYVRLSAIFAKLEGIAPPPIDIGGGESLPYDSGAFDCVFLFSSLQYMDIGAALREVARVLVPGGRVLSSQPTLPVLAADVVAARRQPRLLVHRVTTLVNSLWYGMFDKRLLPNVPGVATVRPVQLTRRQFRRRFSRAGLRPLLELSSQHGRDYVLTAEKMR